LSWYNETMKAMEANITKIDNWFLRYLFHKAHIVLLLLGTNKYIFLLF